MAKKEVKPSRLGNILGAAKAAHKKEVGAGGSIYDPYLSHVRSMRLPSLALMHMLGFSGLRDSCTVLIDGEPGSHKSSLGIEMFNWGYQYGVGGGIIDCENKAAVDIALGELHETILWLPGHFVMQTARSVEDAQIAISALVDKCREMNKDIPRDQQIPLMSLTDPMAGVPSKETIKAVGKLAGAADRGHGGRVEALLWSTWLKVHEQHIVDLPFISIFVNHVKERQKQGTSKPMTEKYNPGGCSQNYATTVALRCSKGKAFASEAYGGKNYNEVYIQCSKNSRGPTGRRTMVRKYWQPRNDGISKFWWDWGRNTAEFLAELTGKHPLRDILDVSKATNDKFTCKALGMKDESPTVIGDAIMADDELVRQSIKILQLRDLAEFDRLTQDDHDKMYEAAHAAHVEYLKAADMTLADEATIGMDDSELVEAQAQEVDGPTFGDDDE